MQRKLIAYFGLFLTALAVAATTIDSADARGRTGSHRVGGYGSHGKGSHYVGGH